MAITIKDIANKAGLSPASVSRILTNRGRFNEDTAIRVRELAHSMGYLKNQSAADLSQQKSRIIGILVPIEHTNFADEIIKGMQNKAHEFGYELLITFIDVNESQQIQTVQSLLSRQILAIFMLAIDMSPAVFKLLINSKVQLLSISNQLDSQIPSISSDNYAMMKKIVDYLVSHGHKKIALIGSSSQFPIVAQLRRQGFIDGLAAHGISYNPDFIWGTTLSYQTGLETIKHFGLPLPFTAAIGSADIISIGLLNSAKDANLDIPNDLSIISIDGTELTQITRPVLTTIQQNFQLMGELAITTLHENKFTEEKVIFTKTKIVPGKTVAINYESI